MLPPQTLPNILAHPAMLVAQCAMSLITAFTKKNYEPSTFNLHLEGITAFF